mmetsp:Transcript_11664/g.38364  ORF Transcript_11664/g.38364 Transcript_11664/m.38364 type:complete len:266 (-) Transcript_11664:1288-2085(-)
MGQFDPTTCLLTCLSFIWTDRRITAESSQMQNLMLLSSPFSSISTKSEGAETGEAGEAAADSRPLSPPRGAPLASRSSFATASSQIPFVADVRRPASERGDETSDGDCSESMVSRRMLMRRPRSRASASARETMFSQGLVSTTVPGRRNRNSVPPVASSTVQTFVCSSHTSPPIARANTLHDDRPSPTPRQSAVATSSLKSRDAIVSGIPRPVSLTLNSSCPSRSPSYVRLTVPTYVCFRALLSKLFAICLNMYMSTFTKTSSPS